MSEIKTILTEEELNEVQLIKSQQNQITFALGETVLRKEGLINAYKTLTSQEQEVLSKLSAKYGDGSIDLTTGEITEAQLPNE